MPNIDPQSIISVVGFLASIFFSLTLLSQMSKSRLNILMASILILSGLTHLLRGLSWEFESANINQLVQALLSLQPILGALFIESVSKKDFHYIQKIFFILVSAVLFYFSLNQSLNNEKIFLIPLVSYHLITLCFFIINMHAGLRMSANVKEANVKTCILFALYIILIFIGVDWAYKFKYISFRLYPLTLPILIFYLSSVIYSAGETNWSKVSSRLMGMFSFSLCLGLISLLVFNESVYNSVYLALINFALLVSVFSLYNQHHYESEPLFEKSKDLFDWKNNKISEIEFLEEINKRPEFHHVSLIKESFIKKEEIEIIHDTKKLGSNVVSKNEILNKKEKLSNEEEALLYLFDLTDTEYIISVPHTKNFIAIKYVSTSAPYIYSDFFHGIAQKMSIYDLSNKGGV